MSGMVLVVFPWVSVDQVWTKSYVGWDHHNSTSSVWALWILNLFTEPRHRLMKHLDALPSFTAWRMVDAQGKSVTRCFVYSFIVFAFPRRGEEHRNLGKVAPGLCKPLTCQVGKQNQSQKQPLAVVGRLTSLQDNKGNKLHLPALKARDSLRSSWISNEAPCLGPSDSQKKLESGLEGAIDLLQGLCASCSGPSKNAL